MRIKKKVESKALKLSFRAKDETTCPVCQKVFRREELLSGSGRLIAGIITDELHRLYEPSVKFGEVYPLTYQATVCPQCLFASMDKDFSSLPKTCVDRAKKDTEKRINDVELIFPNVDYNLDRDLISGAASQYLVLRCYDFYPKEFSPTIKQALASLRTGWLLDDTDKKFPNQHYDWLASLFKKKAMFCYNQAIKLEQAGKEKLSALTNFGPDTDKNYSYEGALYLCALLRFKYAFLGNSSARAPILQEAKRTIAKVFGVGKSSKSKPGPLLEHARGLYERISKELNEADD